MHSLYLVSPFPNEVAVGPFGERPGDSFKCNCYGNAGLFLLGTNHLLFKVFQFEKLAHI